MGKLRLTLWTTALATIAGPTIAVVTDLPDPDWYLDHVLTHSAPGGFAGPRPGPAAHWQRWWADQATASTLARASAQQGFVLATGTLTEHGVSRSAARTAVRRGRWVAPQAGVLAPLDPNQAGANDHTIARRRHALASAAASLRHPGYVVCGRSAAILHGLPTLSVPPIPELTARPAAGLGNRAGLHSFGAALGADEVARWFGVPLTAVARTLVDLARHDRRDGLMAADAALHESLVDAGQIEGALRRAAGWPGVRRARALLALADAAPESPLESIVRLALHDGGFPPPRLQLWIGDYRVDFGWPEHRLILEADGRVKYTDDERWQEKVREHRLRALGWTVERVLWSDAFRGWPAMRTRLRSHF